jgi:hypothetical protein
VAWEKRFSSLCAGTARRRNPRLDSRQASRVATSCHEAVTQAVDQMLQGIANASSLIKDCKKLMPPEYLYNLRIRAPMAYQPHFPLDIQDEYGVPCNKPATYSISEFPASMEFRIARCAHTYFCSALRPSP